MEQQITLEEQLTKQLTELKKRISELRKKGGDVTIPVLLAHPLAHKIKLASHLNDQKIVQSIQQAFQRITTELQETEQENLKRTEREKVETLCKRIHDAIAAGNKPYGAELYRQLRAAFNSLPLDDKRKYQAHCTHLHDQLQEKR